MTMAQPAPQTERARKALEKAKAVRESGRFGPQEIGVPFQIGPGVYAMRGSRGANVGAVVTDEGIVLIDTPLVPQQAWTWRDFLRDVSGGKPFLYIINTDHHRGHIVGNQWFDCPVIAHHVAWRYMRGYRENFTHRVRQLFKRQPEIVRHLQDIRIILPEITFGDRFTVFKGGREVRIIHIGGHTPATSIVYVPDAKVVFTGDLVTCGEHPFMTQAKSKEWLDGLTLVRRLHPEVVVPGHGEVGGTEITEYISEYLRYIRYRVRYYLQAGHTKEETANAIAPDLIPWFPIPKYRRPKITQQIKQGIAKVYQELQKEMGKGDGRKASATTVKQDA